MGEKSKSFMKRHADKVLSVQNESSSILESTQKVGLCKMTKKCKGVVKLSLEAHALERNDS